MREEEHKVEESTRERWYIITNQNKFKFAWDLFIIVLAIYNAVFLPMQIVFNDIEVLYE